MRYYVNYRESDEKGELWRNTWHRALKTRRGTEAWLKRHGYVATDDPNTWHGTEWPYTNDATVYAWDEPPDHVKDLMAREDLGPDS